MGPLKIISRVGGVQFFVLTGWKGNAAQLAANCARTLIADAEPVVAGSKRRRKEVASVDQRACVWRRKGATAWPELTKVTLELLSMHPISASTKRNCSLRGRVCTAARNALSLQRARKMIPFCFNSRAQTASMEDFGLLLDTIEQDTAL
jgi:hypothetical protein